MPELAHAATHEFTLGALTLSSRHHAPENTVGVHKTAVRGIPPAPFRAIGFLLPTIAS